MNADEKKKKIIMLFIALGLILSVIFGVTFSYLAPSINNVESNSTVAFNAGTIAINYENEQNQINASEVLPGWTSIKEFSLTAINNTTISTSGAMNYAIKLIVEKNTFNDGTITYSIEGENVDNNGTIAYVLPNSLKNGASEVILGYGVFDTSSDISKGVTHRYTLTMAFPNKTYESQNEDLGKTLSAHIIIANEGESTFSNLTIIDDNNNLNKTMVLKNDTAYELPNIASKAGAYFLGWNVESGNATINGNKITINGNASIKANYSSTNKTEFAYTGKEQIFTAPVSGKYKLEAWGAQGGYDPDYSNRAKGAYTAGTTLLTKGDIIYIRVGQAGSSSQYESFNGGGRGGGGTSYGYSGGGATDIRYRNDELYARLMVAAGGGGTGVGVYNTAGNGSHAGGLTGYAGGYYSGHTYNNQNGKGGSQVSGGTAGTNIYGGTGTVNSGVFGIGGNNLSTCSGKGASGGGGGYYGGGGGGATASGGHGNGAGGGSSYISGHTGCVAITSASSTAARTGTNGASCATGTTDNLCSVHYSGKIFTNTVMIDGAGYSWTNTKGALQQMPNPSGGYYEPGVGHSGNGYARITMPEIKEGRGLSTITVVSEELKKVITIEAEKGKETEISVEGLTNSSLGFKSFEIEKGEATINKTKITPLSNTIVVRIIYKQIFNWEFAYTGGEQQFIANTSGYYKLEAWGAQGGNSSKGGKGGYSSGAIKLEQNDTLYIYVGGVGPSNASVTNVGGYNGGGYSGNDSGGQSYGGGGATDFRLINGAWNNASGLKSRILIAAGGAGSVSVITTTGGAGGGLMGGNGTSSNSSYNKSTYLPVGSNQTSAGFAYQTTTRSGSFGYAYQTNTSGWGGGGGGGYYGGGNGFGTTGAGGSSYISGHTGCVAIVSDSSTSARTGTDGASCTTGTSDNLCSVHYSGMKFTDTVMIDGAGYAWTNTKGSLQQMPNPSGGYYASGVGHSGNGYARITLIS